MNIEKVLKTLIAEGAKVYVSGSDAFITTRHVLGWEEARSLGVNLILPKEIFDKGETARFPRPKFLRPPNYKFSLGDDGYLLSEEGK